MFIYRCYRISRWMKIFIIVRQCAGFSRLDEKPVAVPGRPTARMCPQQASHDLRRAGDRRHIGSSTQWRQEMISLYVIGRSMRRRRDSTAGRPWRAYRKQFSRYWLAHAAQNTNNQIDYSPYKILANRAVPIDVGFIFHFIVFFSATTWRDNQVVGKKTGRGQCIGYFSCFKRRLHPSSVESWIRPINSS